MHDTIERHYEQSLLYKPSKSRMRRISELLGPCQGKKILDIGCGDGSFGAALRKDGAQVTGIDISKNAIARAETNLDKAIVLNVESDDISSIGEVYDVIIASEVIEHLFDPNAFLRSLKPLIKPQGTIILTTPNFLVFTNRLRMLFGTFHYEDTGFFDRGHIHFFTRPSLQAALIDAGYTIVGENHVFHPKVPTFLARMLPNLFAFQLVVKVELPIQS